MPCSNQFGKKALSYSIIKTSQWKVTVCPFIDKDQHSANVLTHTHPNTHTYGTHTHLYKMFHNSLTISLQYRDTNATALPSFRTWLEPKIHCREQVINRTFQWTTSSLVPRLWLITGWKKQRRPWYTHKTKPRLLCFISICVCVCVCCPSWVNNKSTTKKCLSLSTTVTLPWPLLSKE